VRASWHSRLLGALATFFIYLTGSFIIWLLLLPSIRIARPYGTDGVVLGAFVLLALLAGSLNRNSLITRAGHTGHALIAGLLLAVFSAWIIPLSPSAGEMLTMNSSNLAMSIGLIAALTFMLRTLPGAAKPIKEEKPLTDKDMREYIEKEKLLLSDEEVKRLAARDEGLVCPICTKSSAGEDWRQRWMRCRRDSDPHYCHAWEFEYRNWMCPVCREPVLLAKESEDDGEDSRTKKGLQASKDARLQ